MDGSPRESRPGSVGRRAKRRGNKLLVGGFSNRAARLGTRWDRGYGAEVEGEVSRRDLPRDESRGPQRGDFPG